MRAPASVLSPQRPLPLGEFILLLAALFSMMAYSIDSLLPALPEIGAALVPQDINRAQLVITAFILGNGVGQLLMGPLSDSYGRKPAIVGGAVIYVLGAVLAHGAFSLEALLAARFLQGVGAAAPRVVGMALVRDLHSGRTMARVTSLAFMFFVLVPAVAPFIGQQIIGLWGWRAIFVSYVLFAVVVTAWLWLRQPETLPRAARVPFRAGPILRAASEALGHRVTMVYTAVLCFGFGQLIAYISSAQQVFVDVLGVGDRFPLYFAAIALVSGISGYVNSRLVMRLGMRRLASGGFLVVALASGLMAAAWAAGMPEGLRLPLFMLWSMVMFLMNGVSFGNLNALAMEPMGHIAGTASSVIGAVSTVGAVVIAVPVGLSFDGTPLPLILGAAACSACAWALMRLDPKGRGEV